MEEQINVTYIESFPFYEIDEKLKEELLKRPKKEKTLLSGKLPMLKQFPKVIVTEPVLDELEYYERVKAMMRFPPTIKIPYVVGIAPSEEDDDDEESDSDEYRIKDDDINYINEIRKEDE